MAEEKFSADYIPTTTLEETEVSAIIDELMPYFKELANIFSVNILVDCRNGLPTEVIERLDRPNVIDIHLDSFPSRFRSISSNEIASVFGLTPREPLSVKIPFPIKNTASYRSAKTDLYSPEMKLIGCILGSHLFIYPRIFTSDLLTTEDKVKLVRAIGCWFLPKVILNAFPKHGEAVKRGLEIIRQNYPRFCLPAVQSKEELQKKFGVFIANLNSKNMAHLETRIAKTERDIKKLSEEYFEHLARNSLMIARLESVKTGLTKRNFEKEFETLLIMEPIETVRMKDNRFLVIKTGPLTQIPVFNPEKKVQESFAIGEFLIQIDTQPPVLHQPPRTRVKFYQNNYTGPFRHFHINPDTDTCFGNLPQTDHVGMNPIIDDLVSRFDIVPLVHLILTFLQKEKTRPHERERWDNTLTPKPDEYKSPEERAEEKDRFIQLVGQTVVRSSMGQLKKDILELSGKIDNLHQDILQEMVSLDDNTAMLEMLSDFLMDPENTRKQADRLRESQEIFGIIVSDDELLLCFSCHHQDSDENDYLPDGYILKIPAGSFPELLILSQKKSFQNIPLIDQTKFETGHASTADQDMVADLRLGHILDILEKLKDRILNGMFDPKTRSTEEGGKPNV